MLLTEVIELIDGLEGSWADLEYNDVLRDVIKAIIKKYGMEMQDGVYNNLYYMLQ